MAETSVSQRLDIASSIASQLAKQDPDSQVWLEGPLAEGLAHAHSDIDLRLVPSNTAPDDIAAKIVDGIRVDISVSPRAEIQATTRLLDRYDARLSDLTYFRLVRRQLPSLTLLRTARRWTGTGWDAVLDRDAISVYRMWALADRVEMLLSLTEDLTGLLTDELMENAEIVAQQISRALAGAEAVAAGLPLLGDKWLPSLVPPSRAGRNHELGNAPNASSWFPTVQRRLLAALTSVHMAHAPAGHDAVGDRPLGSWWLPQRYADGWYARYRDSLMPLSDLQVRSWWAQPIGDLDV